MVRVASRNSTNKRNDQHHYSKVNNANDNIYKQWHCRNPAINYPLKENVEFNCRTNAKEYSAGCVNVYYLS